MKIHYTVDGKEFDIEFVSKEQAENFKTVLRNSDIEFTEANAVEEPRYQLCGCIFSAEDERSYAFVCPAGNAQVWDRAWAKCIDQCGNTYRKKVIVQIISMATVSMIRDVAAELGRKKLGTIEVIR